MTTDEYKLLVYIIPIALLLMWDCYRRIKRNYINRAILNESISARLTEPASLHPVFNHNKCIGCGGLRTGMS